MTDQVSHLCETPGTVTVLYILIFIILDSKRADKRFWHTTELETVSRQAQWGVLHQKMETIFFTFRALSPGVKGTGTRLTTHLCLLTSVIHWPLLPLPPICHHGMHTRQLDLYCMLTRNIIASHLHQLLTSDISWPGYEHLCFHMHATCIYVLKPLFFYYRVECLYCETL